VKFLIAKKDLMKQRTGIIGVIMGLLLGVEWELVEWGADSPDHSPNKSPYSDITGMSISGLRGGI